MATDAFALDGRARDLLITGTPPPPVMHRPPLRDSLTDLTGMACGAEARTTPALLIVDDDEHMRCALACIFERRGFRVVTAASLAEAQAEFRARQAWRLVISDYHLPDGTGAELNAWIAEQAAVPPPFLLMSGSGHGEAARSGIDFLAKPFALGALEQRVRILLRQRPG